MCGPGPLQGRAGVSGRDSSQPPTVKPRGCGSPLCRWYPSSSSCFTPGKPSGDCNVGQQRPGHPIPSWHICDGHLAVGIAGPLAGLAPPVLSCSFLLRATPRQAPHTGTTVLSPGEDWGPEVQEGSRPAAKSKETWMEAPQTS